MFARHRNMLKCVIVVMVSMFLISLHEKNYYVAGMFLMEMFLVWKFSKIILLNERPRMEEERKEKNNFWPLLGVCFFCALVSGYCVLIYKEIEITNSLNLSFDTTEIYKMIALVMSAVTLFVGLREIKK